MSLFARYPKAPAMKVFVTLAMALGPLFLLISSSPALEKIQPVEVTARVLKSKIKIGDEIRFLVQVDHPRKISVKSLSEKINLSPFEIKKADASPVRRGQNRVQETYGFTLTVFEIGELEIPPVSVHYEEESGKSGEVRTEPVPVTVLSVGKKLTDKDDIRPIKGPASLSLLRFRTWIFSILCAALSIFLIWRLVVRWMRRNKDLESLKPPHIRVLIELERLKNQGFLEEKKVKEYYTGLSDILRNYMQRLWKLQVHEHTTIEIVEMFKEKNFEKSLVEKIKAVLEETDLVKFAKVLPPRTLSERLEKEILDIVEMTKPVEKATMSGPPAGEVATNS